jgi:ATP-dependent DNA helicase UvrD/PcrA
LLERAEVRDVLAWLRLLLDPQDAAAVVRALARPPIELRQVHLARVIQLARRRKLDLVAGLALASESPSVPPEARERIERFVAMHRRAAAALEELGPEAFIASLIEILATRGRALLQNEGAIERQAGLEQLLALAGTFARRHPSLTPRELAAHLAGLAPPTGRRGRSAAAAGVPAGHASPPGEAFSDEAHGRSAPADATGGAREAGRAEPGAASPASGEEADERLELTLTLLKEDLLESVLRIGGRLGELRLDTELDIAHGVVRYLELLKVAALLQRGGSEPLGDALADVNARLLAAATPLQREILQTSPLDETLLAGRSPRGQREEHSLGPFLPRKGIGLALSASDIETYRSCPLRYKYSRVLRIPTEQTLHQRFGITVHQVLERFHAEGACTLDQMLELLDAGWRRAGLRETGRELVLYEKAREALTRYHARLQDQQSEPVWFERSFAFRLGPHHLRGRVDRVDRIGAGGGAEAFELIDYKTSRPKSAAELADDVQLSLYALAAREAWQLESSRQAYYYVLDDRKVQVPMSARDTESVTDTVLAVGEGILGQRFEPTPSRSACSICGYRIVCPAAEL